MSRVIAGTILIVVFVIGGIWMLTIPGQVGDVSQVEQQPQRNHGNTVSDQGANEPVELAASEFGREVEASSCDLLQLGKLQQFNLDNLQRRESSILSPEAVSSYRGLSSDDLARLVEQDDSLAMMIIGTQLLFNSMGRNPDLAVDYFFYQTPIREITPNPRGLPKLAHQYASMARNMFWEAAIRGRHAAFTFIGLTYQAQGMDAVDLGWISQDAYDGLSDKQKYSLEPRVAYSQLAYVIDPDMLPAGSPNREIFDNSIERLGEHASFLNDLESDFRQRLKRSGRSFPTLPPLTYPDVDEDVIDACEKAGYSRWPG